MRHAACWTGLIASAGWGPGLDTVIDNAVGERLKQQGVMLFQGSTTDAEAVRAAMRGVNYVFHCAALMDDALPWDLIMKVNVEGTGPLETRMSVQAMMLTAWRRAGGWWHHTRHTYHGAGGAGVRSECVCASVECDGVRLRVPTECGRGRTAERLRQRLLCLQGTV